MELDIQTRPSRSSGPPGLQGPQMQACCRPVSGGLSNHGVGQCGGCRVQAAHPQLSQTCGHQPWFPAIHGVLVFPWDLTLSVGKGERQ